MSNIEEDIEKTKQLNNLLKFFRTHGWIPDMSKEINTNGTIEAIEHILSEREQDKKRIKELEEERQLVGMPVKNKRDGRIGVVLHQWESGSVAVLENINPRIINTHDNWSTLEILTDEVKQTQTKCDSIPVQKVKDKIEEYFEDEEWLIEHDLKALCDDEKECREYYINKKIALKDIKKNILDKLNKLLSNVSDEN